jgi:HEAT repeat protein
VKVHFPKVKLALVLTTVLLAVAPEMSGQVTGRIYLEKESYAVGEPLIFTLEIKNATREAIQLYPRVPGQSLGRFSFSMQRAAGGNPAPSCGATWNLGENSADPYELKAGSTYAYQWPLDFWYRIEHEGIYKVAISGNLLFSSLQGGIQQVQFSSDVQLKVVPGEPAHVEEVLRKFEADLRSSDYDIQHNALDVLSTTAPSYFHDDIFRLARDADPFIAVHGVGALDRMNTSDARALLAEIIATRKADSPDEQNLRCSAIKALGNSGDASYLQMLAPYAEHANTCESEFAMIAIAKLGRENAVPLLQGFLQSPQVKQRLSAVTALRLTASPDAVDVLIGALRDKDDGVREKAASSLMILTGTSVTTPDNPTPSPLQLESLWLIWWDKHRKEAKLSEPGPEICRME